GSIRLLHPRTGLLQRVFVGNTKAVGQGGLAWSPDERYLACACENGEVWIWDAIAGCKVRRLPEGPGSVIAWSPDGKEIAVVGGPFTQVHVFDVEANKKRSA